MYENRCHARFVVDLPIAISTVLNSGTGTIIDFSEGGAQIRDASFPKGTRLQIDWQDQTLYAVVMWSEIDRMGVHFEFPLVRGPLYDLMMKMRTIAAARANFVPPARPATGFGRRFAA